MAYTTYTKAQRDNFRVVVADQTTDPNSTDELKITDSSTITWDTTGINIIRANVSSAALKHDLLSNTHTDTTPSACVAGSMIYGFGSITPLWTRLPIGSAGNVLTVTAGLPSWQPPGGGPGAGTDEVLLVPTANKTIHTNTSIIVGDYYRLDSGITLTIESGANLTVV